MKAFWIVTVVIILLALGFIFYPNLKAIATNKPGTPLPDDTDNGTGGGGNNNSGPVTGIINYDKVLSNGSTGAEVQILQGWLNKFNTLLPAPLTPLVVDGKFGPKTLAMLQKLAGVSSITLTQAQKKILNGGR